MYVFVFVCVKWMSFCERDACIFALHVGTALCYDMTMTWYLWKLFSDCSFEFSLPSTGKLELILYVIAICMFVILPTPCYGQANMLTRIARHKATITSTARASNTTWTTIKSTKLNAFSVPYSIRARIIIPKTQSQMLDGRHEHNDKIRCSCSIRYQRHWYLY